ncbi:MAG: hypothetical protein JW863_19865 [Chitinispirillaceae bacterium]|nr:hypothetical protein [Chitinispirillaceae bacterium]
MNVFRTFGTGAIIVLSVMFCFGQDSSGITISPHGLGIMDEGLIFSGYDKNAGNISKVLFNRIFLRIGLDVNLSEKTSFAGSMELKTFNEFPRLVNLGGTRRFYYYIYAHQVELTRKLIENSKLHWYIGGGYFPYKYNKDVRNLGEYLFRSTAYPQTITTEFDFAFARLLGLYSRASYSTGPHTLNADLLLTHNTEWIAIGDVNLSLIASYNLAQLFEVGAGVEFSSLISVDEATTSPPSRSTRYLDGSDTSGYYTFRGTKVMGRLSFDPKKLFNASIFGDSDLVLYSEATLLGTKNYDVALYSPIWYNSILERIPVTGGFNWPTHPLMSYTVVPAFLTFGLQDKGEIDFSDFVDPQVLAAAGAGAVSGVGLWLLQRKFKIKTGLDILNFELEWWGNRYPNSMQGIVDDGLPLPFREGTTEIDSTTYKRDNWKWSVYGAKSFAKHYRLAFQIASDHMRTFAWDWNRQDWEEALRGPDKWYFVVRFGVMF